ncbi:U7 snRNA-associated Sm-like protein LSm11 isoform X2 [Bacillus rossius redtenbacheri]|uniref:U7 snRNA-associated Sm-like protein LSm11 isoform X2 n=1 Tax=Bacillus rossius redtenbacheri TaxID=93214 RepID=UPI002FDEE975
MESDSDSDESEYDLTSNNFNPIKALLNPSRVKLPCPSAPLFDNLNKYASKFLNPQAKQQKKVTPTSQPEASTSQDAAPVRRFLPHQGPVTSQRPQRRERNVLTRMDEPQEGPLAVLRDCMVRRARVKVYTRHMAGIRGHCVAYLAAFDKHWNLALEDVTETWTRKKKRKAPPALGGAQQPVRRRVQPPRVTVLRSDGAREQCQRHVGQLVVRGEQVALVCVHDRS